MSSKLSSSEVVVSMKEGASRAVVSVTLVAAALVAAASIVDAIRTDNLGPIWAVGWLPAVVVACLYRPGSSRACWGRPGRRARS